MNRYISSYFFFFDASVVIFSRRAHFSAMKGFSKLFGNKMGNKLRNSTSISTQKAPIENSADDSPISKISSTLKNVANEAENKPSSLIGPQFNQRRPRRTISISNEPAPVMRFNSLQNMKEGKSLMDLDSISSQMKRDDSQKHDNDIMASFQKSFSERMTIDLPLDELNAASLKADLLLSMIKDKADFLNESLASAQEKAEEVSSQMKIIASKAHSISQTSAVISTKLSHMDQWIENIETSNYSWKIQITELFMTFFSLLSMMFSLLWFNFRRGSKEKKKEE